MKRSPGIPLNYAAPLSVGDVSNERGNTAGPPDLAAADNPERQRTAMTSELSRRRASHNRPRRKAPHETVAQNWTQS